MTSPVLAASSFTDTSGHWAEAYIEAGVKAGYINGYPDKTFKPERNITKAEFFKIVNSLNLGKNKQSKEQLKFEDLTSDKWYYNEVQKGIDRGYIDKANYPGTRLGGDDPITRQETARILGYLADWKANESEAGKFSDKADIKAQNLGYVGAATANKIVEGYPDGTFKPNNYLTRAEVVTIIEIYTQQLKTGQVKDKEPASSSTGRTLNNGKTPASSSSGNIAINGKAPVLK